MKCSFCDKEMDNPDFAKNYPNIVCRECEEAAVNSNGEVPQFDSMGDFGDNPVYINGAKCWRRYKFGGFITMRDDLNCATIAEFYERSGFMKGTQNPIDVSKINCLMSQLNNNQMDTNDPETRQHEYDRRKLLNEFFKKGVIAENDGEFEESAMIFIKVLEYINDSQNIEKAQILFNIVTSYCKAGNFPAAAEYVSKLNSLSDEYPDNIVINEEMAKGLGNIVKAAYYEADDISEANKYLSELNSLSNRFPYNIEINMAMANGLFNSIISHINIGNFPEASNHIKSLKQLADTFSNNTYIQNVWTKAFEYQHQKIESKSHNT